MNPLINLVYLGDSAVMIPAGAAIAAWLVIGGGWRPALLWCLLFGLGLGMVAVSKMAFLGWGLGIRSIDLKGLSGHAMRTTAVMPVILYLFALRGNACVRCGALLFGIASGVAMVFLLVAFDFHSVSESLGGWLLGAVVSLCFIHGFGRFTMQRQNLWVVPCSWLLFTAVWIVLPPPVHEWMTRASISFSGNERLYEWSTWEADR